MCCPKIDLSVTLYVDYSQSLMSGLSLSFSCSFKVLKMKKAALKYLGSLKHVRTLIFCLCTVVRQQANVSALRANVSDLTFLRFAHIQGGYVKHYIEHAQDGFLLCLTCHIRCTVHTEMQPIFASQSGGELALDGKAIKIQLQ